MLLQLTSGTAVRGRGAVVKRCHGFGHHLISQPARRPMCPGIAAVDVAACMPPREGDCWPLFPAKIHCAGFGCCIFKPPRGCICNEISIWHIFQSLSASQRSERGERVPGLPARLHALHSQRPSIFGICIARSQSSPSSVGVAMLSALTLPRQQQTRTSCTSGETCLAAGQSFL